MKKKKTLVVLSGGLDSTVLLHKVVAEGDEVMAISMLYGQRHRVELERARAVTRRLKLDHLVLDLSALAPALAGSALTSGGIDVPHGHYADESMKKTVVPNRNMLLLAVAGAAAISNGCDRIAYGAHAGDHAIYPDCRPEFVAAMGAALALCDWTTPGLYAPFIHSTKADIVREGARLGVPMAETWSCYEGDGAAHCGKCGTCVERVEAFQLAGILDATVYRSAQ